MNDFDVEREREFEVLNKGIDRGERDGLIKSSGYFILCTKHGREKIIR